MTHMIYCVPLIDIRVSKYIINSFSLGPNEKIIKQQKQDEADISDYECLSHWSYQQILGLNIPLCSKIVVTHESASHIGECSRIPSK